MLFEDDQARGGSRKTRNYQSKGALVYKFGSLRGIKPDGEPLLFFRPVIQLFLDPEQLDMHLARWFC
jgi:hypothetical protein